MPRIGRPRGIREEKTQEQRRLREIAEYEAQAQAQEDEEKDDTLDS